MRGKLAILAFVVAILSVGCASKIEGETSTPPPAGGPGASAKHPPGLTQDEIKQDAKH